MVTPAASVEREPEDGPSMLSLCPFLTEGGSELSMPRATHLPPLARSSDSQPI